MKPDGDELSDDLKQFAYLLGTAIGVALFLAVWLLWGQP